MKGPAGVGRSRQRQRTRKDLLQAAARLMQQGRAPSLEEVAEEALVSRATAYRHFPNVEALLVEASLDLAFPDAEALFRDAPRDPAARVALADAAVHRMAEANEPALRMMLMHSLKLSLANGGGPPLRRQNRRTPLIEAALAPARGDFDDEMFDRLTQALALVIGTESMLVFKDVLGLDGEAARDVRLWVIRAIIAAARKAEGREAV